MQNQRQPRFVGYLNLTAEHVTLNLARRKVVMIIKPHLAESARALVAEKLKQEAFHIGVVGLGVVGMNAGGDAHPRHARTGLPQHRVNM